MAIIVGDIHGDVEKVQAFLSYRPEAEHVALGDYLDSFHEPVESQMEGLNLLMASDAVLLLGNHEAHYLEDPLFMFPGYSESNARLFRPLLEKNISRFRAAHVVDGWLCTHAGVIGEIAGDDDIETIAERINRGWSDYLKDRASEFIYSSVFFYNVLFEGELIARDIPQIFGHVEFQNPVRENSYLALDTTNFTNSCWMYDTERAQLVKWQMKPRPERVRWWL